jgi:hypothetical protein
MYCEGKGKDGGGGGGGGGGGQVLYVPPIDPKKRSLLISFQIVPLYFISWPIIDIYIYICIYISFHISSWVLYI